MKKKKWAVDAHKTVAYLVEFIRKYIKCAASDSLVCTSVESLYINFDVPYIFYGNFLKSRVHNCRFSGLGYVLK